MPAIPPLPALPAEPVAPFTPTPVIAAASSTGSSLEPLAYAGSMTPGKAEPLVHGAPRPIPVIARPSADVAKLDRSWRGNVWWLLLLAMVPLAVFTLSPRPTLSERIQQTLTKHPDSQVDIGTEDEGFPDLERFIDLLPAKKLDGAFLSRTSVFPLVFALVASIGFAAAIAYALPGPTSKATSIGGVVLTALFTGTMGVLLLVGMQSTRLFCCIHALYLAALHPRSPFGATLIGFVLGIGVCEEIIKCLPVLWKLWRGTLLNWREACIIGMASGAGFGISEGLLYSFRNYNGIESADAYIVRFMSCVALHTLLSGACAIMIQRKQEHLLEDLDPINWILTLLAIIIVPIFLHGLFNTLTKMHLEAGALGVAVASFFWLAWLIRSARKREESVAKALPNGPRIIRTEKGTRWVGGR
jgi:RsiW-degrading membrane proteinase PrsW (M82 family)